MILKLQKGKIMQQAVKVATRPSRSSLQATVDRLYWENPYLRRIGTKDQYLRYYGTIFPESKIQIPYTHGTTYDLHGGLYPRKPIPVTGAPETEGRNDFFAQLQPEGALQYIPGMNTSTGKSWNKQFWALKEILGKPYFSDTYRSQPIIRLRTEIPNRAGEFDRIGLFDKSGHGKYLDEYKDELGLSGLSDSEFLERLGVNIGETLDEFAARNREIFSQMYDAGEYIGNNRGNIYHVKVNSKNPLRINGGNTYYGERGIFDIAERQGNDAIIHNAADNELGTDVLIIPNANQSNVRILGSTPDMQAFKKWVDFQPRHFVLTKPKGIFANMESKGDALKGLRDINNAIGNVEQRSRIIVTKPTTKEYIRIGSSEPTEKQKAYKLKQEQIARDVRVKNYQRELDRVLREREEKEGIVTEPWMRRAMMRAIEVSPETWTTIPEGKFKLPYRSWYSNGQPMILEGESARDWMDAAGDYFKIGPHSAVLQAEKPLKTASNYFDIVGPVINIQKRDITAPQTSMDALSEGLENLSKLYFKK